MSGVTNALTMSVPTPSPRFDPDNNDWYASAKHNATFVNKKLETEGMEQRMQTYKMYAYKKNPMDESKNGKNRKNEKKGKGVMKPREVKTKRDTVSSTHELASLRKRR